MISQPSFPFVSSTLSSSKFSPLRESGGRLLQLKWKFANHSSLRVSRIHQISGSMPLGLSLTFSPADLELSTELGYYRSCVLCILWHSDLTSHNQTEVKLGPSNLLANPVTPLIWLPYGNSRLGCLPCLSAIVLDFPRTPRHCIKLIPLLKVYTCSQGPKYVCRKSSAPLSFGFSPVEIEL